MLGKQAARTGLRAWRGVAVAEHARALAARAPRSYALDKPLGQALPDEFKKAWLGVAPNLDLPRFPLSYMKPWSKTPDTIPTKLAVNLVLPYKFEIQNKEVFVRRNHIWPAEGLAMDSTSGLHSHFEPSYSLLLNLLREHTIPEVRQLVESNYGEYLAKKEFNEIRWYFARLNGRGFGPNHHYRYHSLSREMECCKRFVQKITLEQGRQENETLDGGALEWVKEVHGHAKKAGLESK